METTEVFHMINIIKIRLLRFTKKVKKVLKIAGRVLLGLGLTLYVIVALVNYSVVQSYLGTMAGRYFSQEWGGEVHIGALHAMPWDHLILDDVLMVDPDGDTVVDIETLRVSFRRFPFRNGGLELERVYLKNGYYHLVCYPPGENGRPTINLQYIINYYTHGAPPPPPSGVVFPVKVGALTINGLHYKMDLPDRRKVVYDKGVEIPHMEFFNIHGRIKDITVLNDDVTCRIVRLRTEERSGFQVSDIRCDVHVSPYEIVAKNLEVTTPKSYITLDAALTYDGWEVMIDYLNTVNHKVIIKEGTSVAMSDAAYWAPVLWGIETQVEAEGTAEGTINDMFADLSLRWGDASGLLLTGHMQDVEIIDSTRFDVDIERLWTNYNDLQAALEGTSYTPVAMKKLIREVDHLDLGLRLRGGLKQASTVNLHMTSGIGDLRADANIKPTDKNGLAFTLDAGSDALSLRMLKSEWVSRTGFDLSTNGVWHNINDINTLKADLQGGLINSVVKGRHLMPVSFEARADGGRWKAEVESTDSLAMMKLVATMDLPDSTKHVTAGLEVEHLDLAAFELMPEKFGNLKTRATVEFNGVDADEMEGNLTLNHTQLGDINVKRLTVHADAHEGSKSIQLQSDPVDMTIHGRFGYGELPLMLRQMTEETVPSDLLTVVPLSEEERQELIDKTLNFHIHWKDDGRFLHSIDETMTLARNTRIDGSYNASELLKMVLRSDSLRMGALVLDNIGMSSRATGTAYLVNLEVQEVNLGTMELLKSTDLSWNSNPQRALVALNWDNDVQTKGDLMLRLKDGEVSVTKPQFTIGETTWNLIIDQLTLNTEDGLKAIGSGIGVRSDEQSVIAKLNLQKQPNDFVELNFGNFSLGGLTDILLQESPISVLGDIDGRFSLFGLNETPYFNANLTIDSCIVNQQPLGNVRLKSNWNAELNMLNLELNGDQINATGWVGLAEKDPSLSFNADFNHFGLGLVAPLLSDFSSRFEGQLHGNFDISGTVSSPVIEGTALVEQGALKIDMTGVTYFFDDTIGFYNKRITLDRFALRDPRGNIAMLDGDIRYNDLTDILIDLRLQTDNLLVLDKQRGEEFYGTLLASAQGTVNGRVDSLQVNVNARTNPGSRLTVPVSDQKQVKAHNYITFVGDESSSTSRRKTKQQNQHLNVEANISITPDVQINLPMDFSDVMVKVSANGTGDLYLTLAGKEEPQVMGSYEITSGTMKLSMLSLIEKNFAIESGSSLGFQGNLPDARFDLKAVYSQRVNLSTLTGGANDLGGSQKYLQVEDVLAVAGTLQEPTISFDIRLPNADASVSEEVFAYIDRNSERDMLNQTISLLLLGQFYNANKSALNGSIATSGGIGTLSSLLSDMVGVVDINVDYKAANEITREQLDVNISKDWGRWYLESTLGYGGESRELQTGDANGAIIDALVGYRLSPLVHLFAYNRTNTNDYTRMDLPYKQGVGLKLTKDFDRWIDLFKTKKKKRF